MERDQGNGKPDGCSPSGFPLQATKPCHRDMTIVHVVDHTLDGLGCLVLECTDCDGWAYDVIEGIAVRVGCA